MPYSFIAIQTLVLATQFNPIFWNTACLIINSGGLEEDNSEDKKEKGTDYTKTAIALGEIISKGIKVSLTDINNSDYTFDPDIENNQILFGLKPLSSINSEVIERIFSNRPYSSFKDFLSKNSFNKKIMISLIKSGAFDNLEKEWADELNIEPRILIMIYYISLICEPKKRLTLQNFNGLIQKDLLPDNDEFDFVKKVFFFNKHLKNNKYKSYYKIDEPAESFWNKHYDLEKLELIDGILCVDQKIWDKQYKDTMSLVREWLNENQQEILKIFNGILFKETWDKYAQGTISSWEMESLCFYYHEHELAKVDPFKYGITKFKNLPEQPIIEKYFKRNNQQIPLFKLNRIIGTVIGKNDNKSSISLLTTTGVVNVKFTKEYYAMYKRQISKINPDGSKTVLEKGWFTRGTKLMVLGFRRDDTFVAKKYSNSPGHQLYKITNIDKNGDLELVYERSS